MSTSWNVCGISRLPKPIESNLEPIIDFSKPKNQTSIQIYFRQNKYKVETRPHQAPVPAPQVLLQAKEIEYPVHRPFSHDLKLSRKKLNRAIHSSMFRHDARGF